MALFTPNIPVPGLPPLLQQKIGPSRPPSSNNPTQQDSLNAQKECWFRNPAVTFPTTHYSEKNSHSLIPHLYPNQDNARVENTGFNPREWILQIPLVNHISPSKNETWATGTLYPNVFNQLSVFFQNKMSGYLQLPDKKVVCKVKNWTYLEVGQEVRDGVIVTVEFLECVDDNLPIQTTIGSISPLATLTATANTLNTVLSPATSPPGLNLSSAFTQLAAYTRQLVALPNNIMASISAQVDQVNSTLIATSTLVQNNINPATTYQIGLSIFQQNKYTQLGATPPVANALVLSLDTLAAVHTAYQSCFNSANTNLVQHLNKSILFTTSLLNYYTSLNSYFTTPLQTPLLQFLTILNGLLQTAETQTNNVFSFVNQNPLSFVQVARYTNNTMDQIMSLNYQLSNLVYIPVNNQISYYSSTGA
jgi:hypothetical protein